MTKEEINKLSSADLQQLSFSDMKKLDDKVKACLLVMEEGAKQEALEELEKLAIERGFSLDVLLGKGEAKPKKKRKPKYVNPDDSTELWTGIGRKPRWVEAQLNKGNSLDDFLIKD